MRIALLNLQNPHEGYAVPDPLWWAAAGQRRRSKHCTAFGLKCLGVLVEQVVFHGLSGTGLNTWFMAC